MPDATIGARGDRQDRFWLTKHGSPSYRHVMVHGGTLAARHRDRRGADWKSDRGRPAHPAPGRATADRAHTPERRRDAVDAPGDALAWADEVDVAWMIVEVPRRC